MKSKVTKLVLAILILFGVGNIASSYFDPPESNIQESLIQKLQIDAVANQTFFIFGNLSENFISGIDNKLFSEGALVLGMFGPMPTGKAVEVTLLIDSWGGYVDLMYNRIAMVNRLKEFNVSFKCYVADARSAAYSFVVSSCDKVILLKGGVMMMHRVSLGGSDMQCPSCKVDDFSMSKLEFKNVKDISFKEYFDLTRNNGDKYFTEEELLKYGIVDEVME